jgi:predicted transcriptional regulator YheO
VDIRHGHITNRKIGDCGSNLGLEVLRGTVQDGDQFNYITYTRDNKILRSSSIYIRGDDGKVIGAICLNLDITRSVQCEEFLHQFNQFSPEAARKGAEFWKSGKHPGEEPPDPPVRETKEVKEVFVNSVRELLDYLIAEAHAQVGKTVSQMRLADKLQFVRFLDQRGAFLITRSGDAVCDFLNISKYTLYRYLELVRGESKVPGPEAGKEAGPGTGEEAVPEADTGA